MENLTHSLVGATIAELALPTDATPAQRRLFFTVGVIAANLPDADLLYTRIMPPPLGYLLHHRGHTHTFAGLVGLSLLIALTLLAPAIRTQVQRSPTRFWALVIAALTSHILLDSWNSYGVHPFWPFDNSWYYGDAVSIFEPWLWVILGLAAGANTRNRAGRTFLLALPIALVMVAGWFNIIQRASAVVLLVVAALISLIGRRWSPKRRSVGASLATAAFVATSLLLSRTAYARAAASLGSSEGASLLDIALTPRPAQPLCWSALTVQMYPASQSYLMRRGTVSVAPGFARFLGCAEGSGVQWTGGTPQSLTTLRDAVRKDCWVRDWMQFARAPSINGDVIVDARFGGASNSGFTAMSIVDGRSCPAHATNWNMPRADLLQD
jgi:inner membrane protein